MAVTTVEEQYPRSSNTNSQWQRTYQRTYLVETNSKYDGPVTVLASLPVQIGQYYLVRDNTGAIVEHDYGSFVVSISPRCTSEDGLTWIVTVDYGPYNPSIFPKNPIQWPIKVSWGTTKFERALQEDVNGKAILNSAGDYFDPPISADDSRTILRIQRCEATFDPSFASQYQDAINKDTFFGQDPGKWKIASITADLEYNVDSGTSDGFYYTVTYEFEFREEGWELQILDQGLKVLDGSGNQSSATEGGKDVTSPILLDGKGKALASGGTPTFLTFEIYSKVDFSKLNLDPSGAPGQG